MVADNGNSEKGEGTVKILLAEDSALLRAGLAELLRAAGHEVVEAVDADSLVAACQATSPDLVVSDVRMPPKMSDDGLEAVYRLRKARADANDTHLPAVILSQYVASAYLDTLLEHGGFGYLLTERVANVAEFTRTLETVAQGGTVVDPEVVKTLIQNRTSGISNLTSREQEILGLMAEGLSNSEISDRLVVSAGAVSKHVANVFIKLGFTPDDENRRVRAVLAWLRHQAN